MKKETSKKTIVMLAEEKNLELILRISSETLKQEIASEN